MLVKKMTGSPQGSFVPCEEAYEPVWRTCWPRWAPDTPEMQRLIEYRPVLDLPGMLDSLLRMSGSAE